MSGIRVCGGQWTSCDSASARAEESRNECRRIVIRDEKHERRATDYDGLSLGKCTGRAAADRIGRGADEGATVSAGYATHDVARLHGLADPSSHIARPFERR